jgi:hypothetical protein
MISPSQAKEREQKRAQPAFDAAVEKIDEMLSTGHRNFALHDHRIKDLLITAYQSAGWTVTYVNDMRDGGYLHFEG